MTAQKYKRSSDPALSHSVKAALGSDYLRLVKALSSVWHTVETSRTVP